VDRYAKHEKPSDKKEIFCGPGTHDYLDSGSAVHTTKCACKERKRGCSISSAYEQGAAGLQRKPIPKRSANPKYIAGLKRMKGFTEWANPANGEHQGVVTCDAEGLLVNARQPEHCKLPRCAFKGPVKQ
jgi:hypothetical protein